LKLEEVSIRRGLGLFKIDQQPSKDLINLDKDLDYIDQAGVGPISCKHPDFNPDSYFKKLKQK